MKKRIFVVIACMVIFSTLYAVKPVDLGPKKSLKKIELTYVKQDVTISRHINPMMFCMAFCERLAYSTGLYKYLSFNDLVKTCLSMYSVVNNGCAGTIKILDYKDGRDLVFNYHYMEKGGDIMLLCTSNYLAETDEVAAEDRLKDSWAMAYYLIGDKLVNYTYVTGKEKAPEQGSPPVALANYYMQDADPGNDGRIERMIMDVKSKEAIDYAILSQYYMMVDDLGKAKLALSKVLDAPNPDKGVPSVELYYITAMELASVKECYKR